jgi:hypothetical protein
MKQEFEMSMIGELN